MIAFFCQGKLLAHTIDILLHCLIQKMWQIVFLCELNLLLPSFNWDSESSVVKQSASSLIGGFGGFLMALLLAIPSALVTDAYRNLLNLGLCLFLAVLTGWLYRQNCRTELKDI